MNQLAFKMYLKPNKVEEYKKRHDKIWPELRHLLKAGIGKYLIFQILKPTVCSPIKKPREGTLSQWVKIP